MLYFYLKPGINGREVRQVSKQHSEILHDRSQHEIRPEEIKFQLGPATVTANGTSPGNGQRELLTANRVGNTVIDHVIVSGSDGAITQEAQLYTKQVRSRADGKILGNYDNVYRWTRRSITLLRTVAGVRSLMVLTYPYDVEIYDPDNPGNMTGPELFYRVEFTGWNDDVLKTEEVRPGTAATPPVIPPNPGYTFLGWIGSYTNVQSDTVISADLQLKRHLVIFLDWDGTLMGSSQVLHGQSAIPPFTPIRAGHRFTGWDPDTKLIIASVTVTAQYIPGIYDVFWVNWDNVLLKQERVSYGSSGSPPITPSRPTYQFTGWDPDYRVITDDTHIRAQFSKAAYNVYFVDRIGTPFEPIDSTDEDGNDIIIPFMHVVPHGGSVVAPTNIEEEPSHRWVGWDHPLTNITSDLCIRGVYELRKFWVMFLNLECTVMLKMGHVSYGGELMPPIPPVIEGHTFTNYWEIFSGDGMNPYYLVGETVFKPIYHRTVQKLIFLLPTNEYLVTDDVLATLSIPWNTTIASNNLTLPVPPPHPTDPSTWKFDRYEYKLENGNTGTLTTHIEITGDMYVYSRYYIL